jgi:hypothetical protein
VKLFGIPVDEVGIVDPFLRPALPGALALVGALDRAELVVGPGDDDRRVEAVFLPEEAGELAQAD